MAQNKKIVKLATMPLRPFISRLKPMDKVDLGLSMYTDSQQTHFFVKSDNVDQMSQEIKALVK